jgi:hypothetical protein
MADIENSTELLKQALDEFRTSSTLSSATLLKLGRAANGLTKDLKDSEKAIEDETDQRLTLAKTLKSFAKDMGSAAQAARENREDFRSLKPAVDAFGTAAKYGASKVGDALNSVGEAISGLSTFLGPKGKIVGMVIGGVAGITGNIMKKYGESAVEFAQMYGKFALDEVQRVSGAFREIANVGGLAGGSIDGFAESARSLGLSMDQYAKLIGRNSEGLAAAGVTVSGGARVLKQITTVGTEFEDKFLKLGFSFEQQTEFSAKFLGYQRNLIKINFNDTIALSEANRKYLEQVDELARLTGQSRDKVAADLEAMSRELRFGATLAIAEQKNTAGAITATAKLLETHGSKEIAEGFKDIFGGATTERSQALMAATNNRASSIAEQLENGQITSAEAMRQFQEAVRETRQALGADEFERRVGKLGTILDPMLVGMRRLSVAQDLNAQTLGTATTEQKKDSEATGENINNLVKAQKSLRDFAVQIDEIVMKKLFPTMAQNVRQLTEVLSAGASKLAEILGVKIAGGTTATAPRQITGEDVNKRRKAAGQAPLSPEAAEAQAARDQVQREMERRNFRLRPRSFEQERGANPVTPTPTAPPPPPPPRVGSFNRMPGANTDALAGLNIKSGESVAGGSADPRLIDLAKKIQEMYPSARFTALNDLFHQRNRPNSKHTQGLALDFALSPPPGSAQEAASIKQSLSGLGFAKVRDEYFADRNANTTGGHFHAELAYGGVVSGPKSGYPALLHGAEAVVPLPGGRSIPVEMTGMSDKIGEQVSMMGEQISRFDQMISLLQSSVDTQNKIYRASVG